MHQEYLYIPPILPLAQGYTVYFEKKGSEDLAYLSQKEKDELEDLFEKIQENPKKKLNQLIALHQKHPNVFEIANLLTFAYLKLKKKKKAENLIEKAFLNFPNSLIAKINYADQLLRKNEWKKVGEVFQDRTDLNTLYPHRTEYHFSEFRGFMVVMSFYHLCLNEKTKAQEYYDLAFQVDPLHPSVILLETKLQKSPSLLQKLAHIFKIP